MFQAYAVQLKNHPQETINLKFCLKPPPTFHPLTIRNIRTSMVKERSCWRQTPHQSDRTPSKFQEKNISGTKSNLSIFKPSLQRKKHIQTQHDPRALELPTKNSHFPSPIENHLELMAVLETCGFHDWREMLEPSRRWIKQSLLDEQFPPVVRWESIHPSQGKNLQNFRKKKTPCLLRWFHSEVAGSNN